MIYWKADTDRLHVTRIEKGRGLSQIETTYKAWILNTSECLTTKYKDDNFVNTVRSHEKKRPINNSTIIISAKLVVELNQTSESSDMEGDIKQLGEK